MKVEEQRGAASFPGQRGIKVHLIKAERDCNRAAEQPVSYRSMAERVSPRQLDDQDALFRLERLAESQAINEERTAGPPYFGSRIEKESFHKGFTLAHDTPKYNGSTKTED
ncbi:hypothetical protein D1007_24219 [Hordeum vulgare]|nr:hypothetical protein D1007_24219 [Hordeum vulgare]